MGYIVIGTEIEKALYLPVITACVIIFMRTEIERALYLPVITALGITLSLSLSL